MPTVHMSLRPSVTSFRQTKSSVEPRLGALLGDISPYLAFLGVGIILFPAGGRDDSHITYWAAWTLRHSGEILNYSGDSVEQSSSLAHTLILAGLSKLIPLSLPTLGGLFSITCGLLTICLFGQLAKRLALPKVPSQWCLATSTPFLYWAYGGLETTIVTVAAVFFLLQVLRVMERHNYLLLSATIFLLLLVRPESLFIECLFFAALGFCCRGSSNTGRVCATGAAITCGLFLGISIVRYWHTGDIWPQPVSAKIGGTNIFSRIHDGSVYIYASCCQYPIFLMFGALLVPFSMGVYRRVGDTRTPIFSVLILLFCYVSFTVMSGGDWMEGGRFLVPAIPFMIAAVIFYCQKTPRGIYVPLIWVLSNFWCSFIFAQRYSMSFLLWEQPLPIEQNANSWSGRYSFFERENRVHYRDMMFLNSAAPVVRWYTKNTPVAVPSILSIQAGMVPFYLFQENFKRLRFVDAFGLSSKDFSKCVLAGHWSRSAFGIEFRYEQYLPNADQFARMCGIEKPDMIFDLDDDEEHRSQLVEKYGYVVVLQQKCHLTGHQPWIGGFAPCNQFLALRGDLFKLHPMHRIVTRFDLGA